MLSIIYSYRNREIQRLRNSLISLKEQTSSEFRVFLVDYGSDNCFSIKTEKLCSEFDFVDYIHHPTQYQPWNKSKAVNSVIKKLQTEYCFISDVDMIFHPEFVEKALQLKSRNKAVYFQVGFLKPINDLENKKFFDFKEYRKSRAGATGMSLFPVEALQQLNGFDEFYHFWGAEDTDIHARLKNAGYEISFYDKEILMVHQWHPSYRSREKKTLTAEFQLKGIIALNHQHLKSGIEQGTTVRNKKGWGNCLTFTELKELEGFSYNYYLNNEKKKIDEFLFGQLPSSDDKILKARIEMGRVEKSIKYKLRKVLKRKRPEFYSMREVNDRLLLHLISFHRDKPYIYKVREDLPIIEIAVKLRS